ncbi:MAG: PilZ domain-containing protein [Gammaproteobacteria bacterium]|nr:PilZ domain-containing protein [Gammaproteobacteria bacterium]
MSDKRKQMRVDVAVRLPVVDVNTGMVVGDLANMSTAGFMVLTNDPRPAHSVFQLSLALPKPIQGVDTLYFGAESLWCNATDDQQQYWIGFHLIDISPRDQEILEQYLASA